MTLALLAPTFLALAIAAAMAAFAVCQNEATR